MAVDMQIQIWVQVGASLASGVLSIGTSYAIERLGGELGGIISSAPSIAVLSSLGLLLPNLMETNFTVTAELLHWFQAIFLTVPVGVVMNAAYLYFWSVLPPFVERRFPEMKISMHVTMVALLAFSAWLVAAVALVLSRDALGTAKLAKDAFHESVKNQKTQVPATTPILQSSHVLFGISGTALAISLGVAIWFGWTPRLAPRGNRNVHSGVILLRGGLVALLRGFAFWMSHIPEVPPSIVGLLFMIPIIQTMTLVTLTLTSSSAVAAGAIGPVMLGMTSTSVYIIACCLLLPCLQWGLAIFVSFCIGALTINLPGLYYLRVRKGVTGLKQQNREIGGK